MRKGKTRRRRAVSYTHLDVYKRQDHVRELAESVDERMKAALAMNPRLSRGQAAILVCLSLADDLKKARRRYEELMRLVEDIR